MSKKRPRGLITLSELCDQDRREVIGLLNFKKRYKKALENGEIKGAYLNKWHH